MTSSGETLDVSTKKKKGIDDAPMVDAVGKMGTGQLIGASGMSGAFLTSFKLWFLPSKISEAELVEVHYDKNLTTLNQQLK